MTEIIQSPSNLDRQIKITEEKLRRVKARGDLLEYIRYIGHVPEFEPLPFQRKIADKLEAVDRGLIKRLMIFVPRRHGKSEISSINFPAKYLCENPGKKVMCVSYAAGLAVDFGREVRNIINSPQSQNLYPVTLRPDSKAANRWHTSNGGQYYAAGVAGGMTGRGFSLGIIEDPHKAQEINSPVAREAVWEWYTKAFRPSCEKGAIILIMQRLHWDDLAGRLLSQAKADGEKWDVLKLQAVDDETGECLWPSRFPLEELMTLKKMDPRMFQAQYQQEPERDTGPYAKREWFRFWLYPLPFVFDEIIMSCDLAFSRRDGISSFVVMQIWGRKGIDYYLLDQWRERADYPTTKLAFIHLCSKWPLCGTKIVENKANGPALESELRDTISGISLREPGSEKGPGKVARFNAATPALQSGHVYLPEPIANPWVETLISEVITFTGKSGEINDQVDTLSQAIDYFEEQHRGTDNLSKLGTM